jgi:hypothetical protein
MARNGGRRLRKTMKTLCGVRLKSRFLRCLGNCSFRSRPGADGSFRSLLAARRKSLARNRHAAKQSECCDSDVARRTNDLVSQKRRTKRITKIPAQSSPSLPKTSAIWTPWKRRGAFRRPAAHRGGRPRRGWPDDPADQHDQRRAVHGRGAVHQVRLRTFEARKWMQREGRIHTSLPASVSRYAL